MFLMCLMYRMLHLIFYHDIRHISHIRHISYIIHLIIEFFFVILR